jgi:Ras-related protein Rab-28
VAAYSGLSSFIKALLELSTSKLTKGFTHQYRWTTAVTMTGGILFSTRFVALYHHFCPIFVEAFQVILLGDGTVGKTSICHRFTNDTFQREYKQTIGLDFFLKRFELEGDVQVALQVWDIGGQSIGSKMLANYIYGSHAIIFAYDCTNFQSFTNVEDWCKLVDQVFVGKSAPSMVLMANKVDMGHLRAVSVQKHTQFVNERNMTSYFVSAKTGDNISPAFFTIASNLAGVPVKKTHLEANQAWSYRLFFLFFAVSERFCHLYRYQWQLILFFFLQRVLTAEVVSEPRKSTQPVSVEKKASRCSLQ